MNSQTIDGVPRKLLQRVVKGDASMGSNALQLVDAWKAMEEIRALLAKPIDEHLLEQPKGSGSLDFDSLLAEYHAVVWASAEEDDCDYDLAGVDIAKKLQAMFRAQVIPAQYDPSPNFSQWFEDHGKAGMQHELGIEELMEGAYEAGVEAGKVKS
jgi:hypothetical protein